MDPLAGDFPQHIAPFPDATQLLFPDPVSVIHPPNLPPQKLRPIRCLAAEAGLLDNHLCAVNRDSSEYLESAAKDEAAGLVAEDPVRLGVGAAREEWNLILKRQVLEDESSSSSSSSSDDSSASVKEPGSCKRKRKSRKKLETFLESLVMKVMEKQEQMHMQLIEMLEKRERERIIREDAWKQREMERMKRDEELRAQETSRSIALISIIHNVLGSENEPEIPQALVTSSWEVGGGRAGDQKDTARDDRHIKKWPDAEVQALITLRTALEHKFRAVPVGSKGSIWEEVSVGMHQMGYKRTAKKCKEKWENINKYFKKSIESGKKPVSCTYFRELDELYKNGIPSPGNASNTAATNENECKSQCPE